MSEKRFIWKTEKLQHSDDEVIMVVDNANKDWKGHILNVIDMLNELNDERMIYKTTIDKRIVELEDENEQLKEERNYFERKKCEYFNKYNKKHLDNIQLKDENEQLRQTIQEVCELLAEANYLFSNDTYYLIPAIEKAIKLLKGGIDE